MKLTCDVHAVPGVIDYLFEANSTEYQSASAICYIASEGERRRQAQQAAFNSLRVRIQPINPTLKSNDATYMHVVILLP